MSFITYIMKIKGKSKTETANSLLLRVLLCLCSLVELLKQNSSPETFLDETYLERVAQEKLNQRTFKN